MGTMVFNPSLPPSNRIITNILSFSFSAKATANGEGEVAEIAVPPKTMLPPPANPKAWIKERRLHCVCS